MGLLLLKIYYKYIIQSYFNKSGYIEPRAAICLPQHFKK